MVGVVGVGAVGVGVLGVGVGVLAVGVVPQATRARVRMAGKRGRRGNNMVHYVRLIMTKLRAEG